MTTQPQSSSTGVMSPYRVLDCSIALAGPLAAQRMGDFGADVIKVEPVNGEWQRVNTNGGRTDRTLNSSFLALNRNKRSLAINLKDPEGQRVIHRLVEDADVFVQNYRPHVAKKLGVDYETLKAINPGLVYVSISGYGTDGPYADRPGQDLLIQGLTGAMYSSGSASEPPRPIGQFVVDTAVAYTALEAALAGLLYRERTGEGQLIEINMLDSAISFQMLELSIFAIDQIPQKRTEEPTAHVLIRPPYGVFPTSDGHIAMGFISTADLAAFFDEPRFLEIDESKHCLENRDAIQSLVRQHTPHWKTDELIQAMLAKGHWVGPVKNYEQTLEDEQVRHNGSFVEYEHPVEGPVKTPGFPMKLHKTPCQVSRGAPLTGEHTREVLKEAGLDEQQVENLLEKGIVGNTEMASA